MLSGWRGMLMTTAVRLGAMLFPVWRRRVVVASVAFVAFWGLYFYPFGIALRTLTWYQDVPMSTAVAISVDAAMTMPFDERLDTIASVMVNRANDLYQFAKYLDYVASNRGYLGFELLGEAAIAMVPRAVWPEKPNMEAIAMRRGDGGGLGG